jgi:glycosyltransferase involved in cell wall biosynthesis
MEKPINVVFMGNFGYPRGMAATKRIQHFIDYLAERSISTRILLLRQGEAQVSKDSAEGTYKGTYYKTIGYDIKLNIHLLFSLPKYFVTGISTLQSWVIKGNKNILYCYGGLTLENVVFVAFSKIAGYRVVLDIVEDDTFIKEKLHFLGKVKWLSGEILEKLIPALADGLIVISSYLKSLYEKDLDTSIPIRLIPISAKCRELATKTRGPGPLKIVYSGSFAKKDGVDLLIDAFERVHKEIGNCVLMLTGSGANLKMYQRRIAENPSIQYLGYLEDEEFGDFLQQADILCITRTGSIYANAGFPFKLGEYLATGKPVIVSDVGDVRYYLDNMTDALIVEPDNIESIIQALKFCINNPEEASRIGLNGKSKCKRHFDPSRNGHRLLELMHSL